MHQTDLRLLSRVILMMLLLGIPVSAMDDVPYLSHIVMGREWSPFSGRWLIGRTRTVQSEKGPKDAEQYIGHGGEELE